MRKNETFEVGDKVAVESTSGWGLCTSNSVGGTEKMPVGTKVVVEVLKAWDDYETGQRYVAKDADGKPVYFGEFDVKAEKV